MVQQLIKYTFAVFLLTISNVLIAQDGVLYSKEYFIQQSDTLPYRLMMPKNFDKTKQYPVVLFLHGSGQRGNDNEVQLLNGGNLFTSEKNRDDFQAIVIFPQCSEDSYWSNAIIDRSTLPLKMEFPLDAKPTKALSLLMQLMDDVSTKTYVDKHRIYVGGLSMGGMGTFEIVYRNPELFAAAFSICGAGNPETAKVYAKTTPFWVFHGANDDVVNPLESIKMVSGILEYGGKPNFTLYAKDNHNSWDSAFSETELLPWLFSNVKD
ncbi:phospholipase/carboxylesterase [Mariniflexile fucanivorans]|uniref:Phospholipase/carboxylesterase n=1 Tax=Mariniflexile fucanivorans TaxID=264023 RepID=A0A4R1RL50_9FLAO|nr:alpha/beta hydrolase-fold protein [Mariniflexile fucanivorans]TCL66935.1 phospholipase/carboxylesterase [Mariniflexile fucanivorans]